MMIRIFYWFLNGKLDFDKSKYRIEILCFEFLCEEDVLKSSEISDGGDILLHS